MPVSDSTRCVRTGRQRLPSQASAKPAKAAKPPAKPTARHRAGPAHARPAKRVKTPLGLGMGSGVQLVPPFQRAAKRASSPPTTMQLAGEVHQTPSKGRNVCGAGTVSTDHVLPSQTSTDGLTAKRPAVMHAVALVQDTPPKACGPSAGSVVASRVQVLPSHDSASVWTVPVLVLNWPVAMHAFAAGQEMPAKLLLTAPGGTITGS
jgi:hypothetical protein